METRGAFGTLHRLLLDPATGLISAAKFKKKYPEYTLKQIKEAQQELQTYQTNTPITKPTTYNSIKANHPGDVIQIDLMDVSNTSTVNDGIHFLLTFIDVYSRFAMQAPMKTKTATSTTKAMRQLLKDFPRKVFNVTSDDGTEFNNATFKKLMDDKKIRHWITPANTPNKMAIIERFHRTLRGRITLLVDHTDSERYIDYLPDLIENYNDTYHRTLKAKPISVLEGDTSQQEHTAVSYGLKLGDRVRRSLKKTTFGKGTTKLSEQVYTISHLLPTSFIISNDQGQELSRPYQGYELKKVGGTIKPAIPEPEVPSGPVEPRAATRATAKKKRLQKRDPAFNDKNTHQVDDFGVVTTTRRHLQPNDTKRKTNRPVRYND